MSTITPPRQLQQPERAQLARWLVIAIMLVLAVQFFRIQILKYTTFALRSDNNRIRALPIPAARGTIYDRNGIVVAENVPGYSIAVLPPSVDYLRVVLTRLAVILGHSEEKVDLLIATYRRHPDRPVIVEADASFSEVSAIEERRAALSSGIIVEAAPKRHYPIGSTLAHVVGYVAEINEDELRQPEYEAYKPGRIVGQTGVERVYERTLSGEPGTRYIEVNALGRLVGDFKSEETVPSRPGQDLHLNIDVALQQRAVELLPDSMAGAVVVLEAKGGAVLALHSAPTFDPNEFVGGMEPVAWRALNTDPERPLFNRAVSATYPPGSVFKPVLAAIAMREGYARLGTHMPIPCRGALLYYGRVFRDWTPLGHGNVDLRSAIRVSCDVYFYQLGLKIGLDKILSGVPDFGFGRATGIDLPSEIPGVFPTNQLAQFYAALANDGILPTPRIARDGALAEPAGRLPLDAQQLAALRLALVDVVNAPNGTGTLARLERWTVAGKTGTAQNPHGEDHAWFVGFAPAESAEIVVAVIVEAGGYGSAVAAPIVGQLIQYYLGQGEPEPGIQTVAGR
jgi:penicillin-binding protein 2